MCEYCNGKEKQLKHTHSCIDGFTSVSVCCGEIHVAIIESDDGGGWCYIKINHCPMCGRKLESE